MRIGILSDPHLGFSRYTKVSDKGVNVREGDFYRAFLDAVENLMDADVDAILDLGDLADTPHPKKRAIHILVDAINATGLPWWSVNGNHTLVRHSTDIHLYDLLERYCKRFTGIQYATNVQALDNALLVPYGTSEEIKLALFAAHQAEPAFIAGHFACDDVLPDGHDISVSDLPKAIPTLLGHFHGRSMPSRAGHPTYIGATERKAWGEAQNPTGVAVYDTDAKALTFIDHETRPWIDLEADTSTYLDVITDAMRDREDQPIVRLTVAATKEEYRGIDEIAVRRVASGALDLLVRRLPTDVEEAVASEAVDFNLVSDWRSQVKDASIPKGVKRADVEAAGVDALTAAGVAA